MCLAKISKTVIFLTLVASGLISIRIASEMTGPTLPMVINTWPFINATVKAWSVIREGQGSALDAVEQGCSVCEEEQCDGTVGYGGSPDENGETTLDAMIMDGPTHQVGAVAALRNVKDAISVARKVMEHTTHTLLVGSQATEFAVMMGFEKENLTTENSSQMYKEWTENHCQPNFWKNVSPNSSNSCGPYSPSTKQNSSEYNFNTDNHDTIGMIVIDIDQTIAGGTSTNGAKHKIPGRVGDSPIPGSGAYVDQRVGGAAATGDGDVMMRFLPSLVTVELMRAGKSPSKAAQEALLNIASYHNDFMGAIVATTIQGTYGAACYGFPEFKYSVSNPLLIEPTIQSVQCLPKV